MKTPEGISPGDLRMEGGHRSKVGLVSLGSIGRRADRLLQPFEIAVQGFDPDLPKEQASELGVALAPLENIFRDCDVVSIHTPWIPQTERMFTGRLVESMKSGATLINTSRGAVIAEDEMCEVLSRRSDLSAVLEVTCSEPTAPDSPLRTHPNVVLTPHIAGSMQMECSRMASWMVEEVGRFVSGEPLRHAVTREMSPTMA